MVIMNIDEEYFSGHAKRIKRAKYPTPSNNNTHKSHSWDFSHKLSSSFTSYESGARDGTGAV